MRLQLNTSPNGFGTNSLIARTTKIPGDIMKTESLQNPPLSTAVFLNLTSKSQSQHRNLLEQRYKTHTLTCMPNEASMKYGLKLKI